MIYEVGKHKVQHGDLMDGIDELMGTEKAFITYSDPPWGQGNLKYWQTINHKMTGAAVKEVHLTEFLNSIFWIAQIYTTGYFLIEYGKRWHDMIKQAGEGRGFNHLGSVELQYKSGSRLLPLDLHVFSKELSVPVGYFENLYHVYGYETLQRAVKPLARAGEIILDPACGTGYTARIALETGMDFRGNEINMARLQKAIDLLENA